ncbi:MAG: Tol biopolymer transport system component [Verrucomicrobiales bacterium]|jgi:Tol biopolymer transport system component
MTVNQKCSLLGAAVCALSGVSPAEELTLQASLAASPHRLVCESYGDDNWELFIMNADGSGRKNLTNTPDANELYPQVSPDGKQVCFVADTGKGRDTVRSTWVMNIDGSGRTKVADNARQPTWSPDSKTIAWLPQEYPKWNVVDYYTRGMMLYDVATGDSRPHQNDKLHHLYNPSFSADGKWIISTVHAGMGFDHAIIVFPVDGTEVYNLGIHGCRPCFHPTSNRIAWGEDDQTVVLAELKFDSEGKPSLGAEQLRILTSDKTRKVYHVDWSPDGKYVSVSSGPDGEGDMTKPFTHQSACEIVGVYAKGWDIYAIPTDVGGKVDLADEKGTFFKITKDGASNKESDWVPTG